MNNRWSLSKYTEYCAKMMFDPPSISEEVKNAVEEIKVKQGCPKRGIFSPLLWYVMDNRIGLRRGQSNSCEQAKRSSRVN